MRNSGPERKGHGIRNQSWEPILLGVLSKGESECETARSGYGTTDMGEHNLWKLAKTGMIEQFDYDQIGFCETCVGGKHHCSPFEKSKRHTNHWS